MKFSSRLLLSNWSVPLLRFVEVSEEQVVGRCKSSRSLFKADALVKNETLASSSVKNQCRKQVYWRLSAVVSVKVTNKFKSDESVHINRDLASSGNRLRRAVLREWSVKYDVFKYCGYKWMQVKQSSNQESVKGRVSVNTGSHPMGSHVQYASRWGLWETECWPDCGKCTTDDLIIIRERSHLPAWPCVSGFV